MQIDISDPARFEMRRRGLDDTLVMAAAQRADR
jgi:hypothetical protein